MLRYKEEGCTTVILKSGETYRFNRQDFDNISSFVMSGSPWWSGNTYGGQRCIIKVGEIAGVCEHTPESLALNDLELKEEKELEAING